MKKFYKSNYKVIIKLKTESCPYRTCETLNDNFVSLWHTKNVNNLNNVNEHFIREFT